MKVTKNEGRVVLKLLKDYGKEYNANSMAKEIGITPMGALKILRHLEKDGVVKPKTMGRAVFYKINLENEYAQSYALFLLQKEIKDSKPAARRWVNEIRGIKNAQVAILFGSVLSNERDAKDIDVVFVAESRNFSKLKEEIDEKNRINTKKIHPVFQTIKDFKENLRKGDKIIVNALKSGLVVYGHKKLIDFLGGKKGF